MKDHFLLMAVILITLMGALQIVATLSGSQETKIAATEHMSSSDGRPNSK